MDTSTPDPLDTPMDSGDGGGVGGGGGEGGDDVSAILRQFSCLGTNDKEVLVKELQKIVGDTVINEYTARFVLDMNDWNLQLAVGSYFDLLANNTPITGPPSFVGGDGFGVGMNAAFLPSANHHRFPNSTATSTSYPLPPLGLAPIPIIGSTPAFSSLLIDPPTQEIAVSLTPSTALTMYLVIQNDGGTRWPPGCSLRYIQGDQNVVVDKPDNGWTTERIPVDNNVSINNCDSNGGIADDENWEVDTNSTNTSSMPPCGLEPQASVRLPIILYHALPTLTPITMTWQLCSPDGYLFGRLINFKVEVNNIVENVMEGFRRLRTHEQQEHHNNDLSLS